MASEVVQKELAQRLERERTQLEQQVRGGHLVRLSSPNPLRPCLRSCVS